VFFFLFPLVFGFFEGLSGGRAIPPVAIFTLMIVGAVFGAIPGYLAGCAVAGILLVMDLTESWFARWRKASEPDDDPWPPRTNSPPPEVAPTPRNAA
jgi:hypothetical protein